MSISRRNFLTLLGAALAGATGGSIAARSGATKAAATGKAASAKTDDVWIVREIGAVRTGAVPITLEHRQTNERLVVEACRRGSGHAPVAQSERFDLFLVNQGAGDVRTERAHVLAARALASALNRLPSDQVPNVLTMSDRASKHPELLEINDDLLKV